MGHVTKPTPAKCSQGALSPKDCKAVASHVLGKTTGINTGDLRSEWICPCSFAAKNSQTDTWKGGLGLLSKNASAMIKPNITFWICLGCGNAGNGPTSDGYVTSCSWDAVASQPSVLFWNNFKKLTGLMCSNLIRPSGDTFYHSIIATNSNQDFTVTFASVFLFANTVKCANMFRSVSGTFLQAPDLKSFLSSDRSDALPAHGTHMGFCLLKLLLMRSFGTHLKATPQAGMQVRFRLVAESVSGSLKWTWTEVAANILVQLEKTLEAGHCREI